MSTAYPPSSGLLRQYAALLRETTADAQRELLELGASLPRRRDNPWRSYPTCYLPDAISGVLRIGRLASALEALFADPDAVSGARLRHCVNHELAASGIRRPVLEPSAGPSAACHEREARNQLVALVRSAASQLSSVSEHLLYGWAAFARRTMESVPQCDADFHDLDHAIRELNALRDVSLKLEAILRCASVLGADDGPLFQLALDLITSARGDIPSGETKPEPSWQIDSSKKAGR